MNLIEVRYATRRALDPPLAPWTAVVGRRGRYRHAARHGLEALVKESALESDDRLADVKPFARLTVARLRSDTLAEFLDTALRARDRSGPIETMAYYGRGPHGWWGVYPAVHASATRVRPREPNPPRYHEALVEIHSHHGFEARFSATDDADETGLRIYVVVGRLFSDRPEIAVRAGVYGKFHPLRAKDVFEGVDGVLDEFVTRRKEACR